MLLEAWELVWRWGYEDMPFQASIGLRALALDRRNHILTFCIASWLPFAWFSLTVAICLLRVFATGKRFRILRDCNPWSFEQASHKNAPPSEYAHNGDLKASISDARKENQKEESRIAYANMLKLVNPSSIQTTMPQMSYITTNLSRNVTWSISQSQESVRYMKHQPIAGDIDSKPRKFQRPLSIYSPRSKPTSDLSIRELLK